MDLSRVELVIVSAFVVLLLVVVMLQSQRISKLTHRITRVERAVHPQLPPGTSGLPPEVEQEVRRLVHADKKLMAIKLVHQHTGLALKEAKQLVERF